MTLQGAIVDLDGTVYVGGDVVAGVPAALDRLRDAGLDPLFFSNNPVKDGQEYVEYLRERGVDARDGEACSSGVVTTAHLREHHADDPILCIGDDGFRDQLLDAGLTLTDDPEESAVLVASWTDEFGYEDMRRALVAVDDGTPFFGTDPDRTFQVAEETVVPGSGAIVGSIAAAVGRDPDAVFGKPSAAARAFALDRLGVSPEECLVVGDRLDTDIELGAQAGMTTVLVLSGVTDRGDIQTSPHRPDYVLEDLGDIDEVLADL